MRREIDLIVVHHSAGWGGTFEEIRNLHVKGNGWSDIGYHAIITNGKDIGGKLSSDAPLGMLFRGRPEQTPGAHCRGSNRSSLGVCVIGNFETMPANNEQTQTLTYLLREWCQRYNLPCDTSVIVGHKEVHGHHSNSCPGINLFLQLPRIIRHAAKVM